MEVLITGADQLQRLGLSLKQAGNSDLRKDMLRGLRVAAKPLLEDVKDSARDTLPKAGGLNEFVATGKYSVRNKLAGRNAGVRLVGTKSGHDIAAIDRGKVRHPVFGHAVWATQDVTPGFWEKPLLAGRPKVQFELLRVMDEINYKIARRI